MQAVKNMELFHGSAGMTKSPKLELEATLEDEPLCGDDKDDNDDQGRVEISTSLQRKSFTKNDNHVEITLKPNAPPGPA